MSTSSTRSKLRSYLRSLSRRRSRGTVTADDVHTFLSKRGVQRKANVRLSYINSVLRGPDFMNVGNIPSSRPVARGRVISEWMASN